MDPDQPEAGSSTLPTTAPPAPLTNNDIHNILIALSTNMHELTDRVLILTNQVSVYTTAATAAAPAAAAATVAVCPKSKDNFKRPESWKGKGTSADARYFLATFSNWAFHMEDQLNDWDAVHNNWARNDGKWIQAVCKLMDEDARTWILPHLEELRRGTIPFRTSWQQFEWEFIKPWIPQDLTESAREALKNFKQGKNSVVEFMAKFDQHTSQTGWSAADHRQRFYDGLNDHIKRHTFLHRPTYRHLRRTQKCCVKTRQAYASKRS